MPMARSRGLPRALSFQKIEGDRKLKLVRPLSAFIAKHSLIVQPVAGELAYKVKP
jgi:hypothetical protein